MRGSVLATKSEHACHYCGIWRGTTRDHVVPLSLIFPLRRRDLKPGSENIVQACPDCNLRKDSYRVLHDCEKCDWLWRRYGPDDYESVVRTITLKSVTSRARNRYKAWIEERPEQRHVVAGVQEVEEFVVPNWML